MLIELKRTAHYYYSIRPTSPQIQSEKYQFAYQYAIVVAFDRAINKHGYKYDDMQLAIEIILKRLTMKFILILASDLNTGTVDERIATNECVESMWHAILKFVGKAQHL